MKLNKHEVLLVTGGAVASCVLGKILKCKKTRETCVKAIAKGLETRDNFERTVAKMKEEAEDIYAEAIIANAAEKFDFEDVEEDLEEVTL